MSRKRRKYVALKVTLFFLFIFLLSLFFLFAFSLFTIIFLNKTVALDTDLKECEMEGRKIRYIKKIET
jgi:hypothetical protein